MKTRLIWITVISIALFAITTAFAQQGGERVRREGGMGAGLFRPRPQLMIDLFDADKNGEISNKEWVDVFKAIDENGDGKITDEELQKYNQKLEEQALKERFKSLDKDGDGALTKEEFGGNEQIFNRLDANGDGKITLEEMKQATERMRTMGEGGRARGTIEGGKGERVKERKEKGKE